ncbi:MAG: hypothetical protein OSB62_06160 [Alphaproteobacteria bacterium]|nr:hypothetical protein [Alphaproteobacteria bacterium]
MPSPQNITRDRKYRGYVKSFELCLESKTLTLYFEGGPRQKVLKLKTLHKLKFNIRTPEGAHHQELVVFYKDTRKETFIIGDYQGITRMYNILGAVADFHGVALSLDQRHER